MDRNLIYPIFKKYFDNFSVGKIDNTKLFNINIISSLRMEGKLSRLIIFVLFLGCVMGQTKYLNFNINPVLVSRANFFLNMLSSQLKTYNWVSYTRTMLRNTLTNTLTWLR